MPRRPALLFLAVAVAAVVASGAASTAAASPRLGQARRAQVSALVDRFVKAVVLRRDLAAGWDLSGPNIRGGSTRAAWVAGRGVAVEGFPVRGKSFRNSWTLRFATRTEIGITVLLRTRSQQISENVLLDRRRGRWVFDAFYPDGIFRLSPGHHGSCGTAKCEVTGINDFAAGPPPAGPAGHSARIGKQWFLFGLGGLAGLAVASVLGALLYVRRRDRRARASYLAGRG